MPSSKRLPLGDRLLPALLDRLIDEDPLNRGVIEMNLAMSRTAYRKSVLRDVRWLFNSINSESEIDFSGYDEAIKSVINYGLPALAGQRISELDWPKIELLMRDAIARFEPRVLPDTLEVRAIRSKDALGHHNLLAFEVRGQLWSEPYPIELLLRSQIDLESGVVSVTDNADSVAS